MGHPNNSFILFFYFNEGLVLLELLLTDGLWYKKSAISGLSYQQY